MATEMGGATIDKPGAAPTSSDRGLIPALFRHPARGWTAIAAAPASIGGLYAGIAVPLTAIGPVARMIHALVFGTASMGIIQYRPTLGGAIVTALIGWAAALVATWLLALAIDMAAPWFGGTRDRLAATKVAVYASTAWWIAAAFAILPAIGFLEIIGLYSLVLAVTGAPLLMRAGEDRGVYLGFTAAGAALALLVAAMLLPAAIGRSWWQPTVETATGRQVVTGAPAIPGSRLVATSTTDKKAAVTPGAALGAAQGAVAASSLQALLPERVGSFVRTTLESQSNLSAGTASADAKATYVQDTSSFTLTISDAGQTGALATNNSVIAGTVNRVTDSGYQRSSVVNGIRVIEKWNNADHGGNFSRTVGGRFTVEAQGTAPSIDVLRAAVGAVDQARLTALAP